MKEQDLISEIYKRLNNLWFVFSNVFHHLQDTEPKTCREFPILFNILKDSMLGIEEYLNNGIGETIGLKYLKLCGLLQLCVTQQDSLIQICKLRNLAYPSYEEFGDIRRLRNDAVGHPTNNNEFYYTYIDKSNITEETIDVSNIGSINNYETVNYNDSILNHLQILSNWLEIVTDEYQQNIIWQ